jgi:hypothetical protein
MKVWHDPLLTPAGRQRDNSSSDGRAREEEASDDGDNGKRRRRAEPPKRTGVRIIAGPNGERDPREVERERLLGRVLAAEGRPSISAAVESYREAGFELPRMQDVWLQVLEHNDEERVGEAITELTGLLQEEEPKRRKVLESRLRRIEDLAEMASTRESAASLRRMLHTRYAETLDPTPQTPVVR